MIDIKKEFWKALTCISPVLNAKVLYYSAYGKRLNLTHPQTFHEKLQWLKLNRYIKDPMVRQCADKYRVRKYVKELGFGDSLIPLIASYDHAEQIQWNALPDTFVLKWNFGCGMNIVCQDKSAWNQEDVICRMQKWDKNDDYLMHGELQYNCQHKILVEKYLRPEHGGLPADYKVYCFNGKPLAILFIDGRATVGQTAAFFDTNWQFLSETGKGAYVKFQEHPDAPRFLQKMLDASSKLSQPFEFVRIDFYEVDNHLYFGEMTFTPAGGFFTSQCKIDGKTMGEILKISTDEHVG
ncbi:MAG: hypothetical protein IJ180_05545 [Bacteroidales bacterium]|nr:hypothetical protein [Bacteroidales bacterium]